MEELHHINPSNDGNSAPTEPPSSCKAEGIDSTCSTPFASAPSSPGCPRPSSSCATDGTHASYFYSAPSSPVHFAFSSPPSAGSSAGRNGSSSRGSDDFDFFSRVSAYAGGTQAPRSMISADELFLNGQIRPMGLMSPNFSPGVDLEGAERELDGEGGEREGSARDLRSRSRSIHRRTRSMSPVRKSSFQWEEEETQTEHEKGEGVDDPKRSEEEEDPIPSPSACATSRRSSKKWVFLKELLYRSKSEGRGSTKDKFWHSISFSPSKDKDSKPRNLDHETAFSGSAKPLTAPPKKPGSAAGKRRKPAASAHEKHYAAKRAQAEEMRKRTFLPYRQGLLLGCLGFSSKSYGAMNGLARTLNTVSASR